MARRVPSGAEVRPMNREELERRVSVAATTWAKVHEEWVDAINRGTYHWSERESNYRAQDEARRRLTLAEQDLKAAIRARDEAREERR